MSVNSVDTNSAKYLGQLLVQQALAQVTSDTTSTSSSGSLGDQLSLSPAAQALAQVPAAVTQAMTDLMGPQKNTSADATQLKAYLQAHPQGMANILAALNGGSGTYSASGSLTSGNPVLQMLTGSSGANSSVTGTALQNLLGDPNQDPLLASLNSSDSGSTSLFG